MPYVEPDASCGVDAPEELGANGGIECGAVVVLQDRDDPSGASVRLPYLRLRAISNPNGNAPLFILAGGPGQSVVSSDTLTLLQSDLLGPILQGRDVVLLEQRGTYNALPRLDCSAVAEADRTSLINSLTPESAEAAELEALRACIADLQSNDVDLTKYTTADSAQDIAEATAVLGYERIVFYGVSYATLLGQYMMRDVPEVLEAVVLDGVEAPSTRSWVERRAVDAQWGLDALIDRCQSEASCASAYDVAALVDQVFSKFDEGAVTVTLPAPDALDGPAEITLTVTEDDLADYLYSLQTSKYGVAALPLILTQMAALAPKDLGAMLAEPAIAAAAVPPGPPEMAQLMHFAMVCSDDPVTSFDEVETEGAGRYALAFARSAAQTYTKGCAAVDVPQISDDYDADLQSDLPVLMLSGGFDVQTPAFLADEVATGFTNATHVTFPQGFHGQIPNINRCAMQVMMDFLDDLDGEPDTSCVAQVANLPFVLPDAGQPVND